MTQLGVRIAQEEANTVDTSGVPFAPTDRSNIPNQRYYHRDFFNLENEKLWPHVWQMACRLEEIQRWRLRRVLGLGVFGLCGSHEPDRGQGLPESVPSSWHSAGSGMRNLSWRPDRLPVSCLAVESDGSPHLPMYGSAGFDERVLNPTTSHLSSAR